MTPAESSNHSSLCHADVHTPEWPGKTFSTALQVAPPPPHVEEYRGHPPLPRLTIPVAVRRYVGEWLVRNGHTLQYICNTNSLKQCMIKIDYVGLQSGRSGFKPKDPPTLMMLPELEHHPSLSSLLNSLCHKSNQELSRYRGELINKTLMW